MSPIFGENRKKIELVQVNSRLCHHCGACVATCPQNALFLWNSYLEVNQQACEGCGRCVRICPLAAISFIKGG